MIDDFLPPFARRTPRQQRILVTLWFVGSLTAILAFIAIVFLAWINARIFLLAGLCTLMATIVLGMYLDAKNRRERGPELVGTIAVALVPLGLFFGMLYDLIGTLFNLCTS